MSIAVIASQLKEHCSCFSESTLDELTDVTTELVHLLSLSTCWQQQTCGSLLLEERVERERYICSSSQRCCKQIHRFRPYFQANIQEVTISLFIEDGLKTRVVELSEAEFATTNARGYAEILVDLQHHNLCCRNACQSFYIEYKYLAGYEELPECLFPEVCDVVKTLTATRLGCGGLDDCCELDQSEVGYVLKSHKKGELSWTWTKDTESLEYLYSQLIVTNRFKSLSMISLCGTHSLEHSNELWAISSNER